MKKLLLKISLLNFTLAIPVLALTSSFNQDYSENYMEQQMRSLTISKVPKWVKGTYKFLNIKHRLYMCENNQSSLSIINGFNGKVHWTKFSDINNDAFFSDK